MMSVRLSERIGKADTAKEENKEINPFAAYY